VRDIIDITKKAPKLTQGDLKCYFYQIPLETQVQDFFGVDIAGETFKVTRLPMGAVISVFVATALAKTLHTEAVGTTPNLDNLVSSGSNAEALREVARRTGATFIEGEIIEGTTMDVLGVRVDTVRKTVRLAENFMNRHGDLLRETIHREIFFDNISFLQLWRVFGACYSGTWKWHADPWQIASR
jgi:hypothetical protein